MFDLPVSWLEHAITAISQLSIWPQDSFFTQEMNLRGLLATLLVCFVCGAMGTFVIGNRMAFFSDALAHCAFAGVGLGILLSVLGNAGDDEAMRQGITLVMVCFGVAIGILIAFVREQTTLESDTVIGVFFAAAIGIGAIVTRLSRETRYFKIEDFIFGNPLFVDDWQILLLFLLAVVTLAFLCVTYNWLILSSASPSLAHSRRVPIRMCRYLFIVLLAVLVNLSQRITGTLLINGLLIVPAATAVNLSRNLRQMFWYSIGIALVIGAAGRFLSWEINCEFQNRGLRLSIGDSGAIVVLSVIVFVLSMPARRWLRRA